MDISENLEVPEVEGSSARRVADVVRVHGEEIVEGSGRVDGAGCSGESVLVGLSVGVGGIVEDLGEGAGSGDADIPVKAIGAMYGALGGVGFVIDEVKVEGGGVRADANAEGLGTEDLPEAFVVEDIGDGPWDAEGGVVSGEDLEVDVVGKIMDGVEGARVGPVGIFVSGEVGDEEMVGRGGDARVWILLVSEGSEVERERDGCS